MNSIHHQSGFATAEEVQGEFDVLSAQNAPGPAAPAAVATTAAPPVSATPADQGNQASSSNDSSSKDSSQAPAKRPYPAPRRFRPSAVRRDCGLISMTAAA